MMRKLIAIFICIFVLTSIGLYTRPSYILIGQINWIDVLTKGYYVGSIPKIFTQNMIDESFIWVLKFSGVGLILGIVVSVILNSKAPKKSKKKS
jgi:hypothetical protein